MKKKLLKLCAIGLAICTIFSCMAFSASAVDESAESLPKWDFGDVSNATQLYYAGNVVEYVSVYNEGVTNATPAVEGKCWLNVPSLLPNADYTDCAVWLGDGGPNFSHKYACNDYSMGLAFTAPQTGTVEFTLQSKFNNSNTNVYVGINGEMAWNGNGTFKNYVAVHNDHTTDMHKWTVRVDVRKGDKVLFISGQATGDNVASVLYMNSAKYTRVSSDVSGSSWDFGDISGVTNLVYWCDVVEYVSVYNEGVANATPAVLGTCWLESLGVSRSLLPNADYTTCAVWLGGDGPNFGHEYGHNDYSMGLAFTAPQTGTVEFTLQSKFKNSNTNVYVGINGKMEWNGNGTFKNYVAVHNDHTTTDMHQWTVRVDVTKGDKVLFISGQATGDNVASVLYMNSAKYIAGDLKQAPITYLCEQATAPSANKFDIRLISAVCKDKVETGMELGYVITVKYGDTVKVDGQSYALKNAYTSLSAYGADGNQTDELNPMQGTYLTAGVIKNLDAKQTVTVTLKTYAKTATDVFTYGEEVTLTYVNGKFQNH